jgi:hypothetical protein
LHKTYSGFLTCFGGGAGGGIGAAFITGGFLESVLGLSLRIRIIRLFIVQLPFFVGGGGGGGGGAGAVFNLEKAGLAEPRTKCIF